MCLYFVYDGNAMQIYALRATYMKGAVFRTMKIVRN